MTVIEEKNPVVEEMNHTDLEWPMRRRLLFGAAAAAAVMPFAAFAQKLSEVPVHFLEAQGVGTPNFVARLLAQYFQRYREQHFYVVNRTGASGAIGMEDLARAKPDGYTVQVFPSGILSLPLFHAHLPFNVLKSFQPIGLIGTASFALVVNNKVPVDNAQQFIAYAKAHPGMNYGSTGIGTYFYVHMEEFKRATGLKLTHIPYRTFGPALTGLLGGRVSVMFMPAHIAVRLAEARRLKLLGVTGPARSPLYPNVPSLVEQGIDVPGQPWYGMWGPAGMPETVVAKFNHDLNAILAEPALRQKLGKVGVEVKTSTPEELAHLLKSTYEHLAKTVREEHLSPI